MMVEKASQSERVGAFVPTYNRPDLVRACVMQLLQQSRPPDLICIHQNGNDESYRWAIEDIDFDGLIWIHSPSKLRQHDWYLKPLQRLIDEGCSHFFWIDHDDIYFRHHIRSGLVDLVQHDFSVARNCGLMYLRSDAFRYLPVVEFTSHAPGGMSASMCFTRAFAIALAADIAADQAETYTDNVVAKVTMPRFRTLRSPRLSSVYVSHGGSLTSSTWLDAQLPKASVAMVSQEHQKDNPLQTDTGGASASVRLFQIAYSHETLVEVEPGFEPLNNLENLRPDWYEYGPIARYVTDSVLEEDTLYGFFSPKFALKTGLTGQQALAHVQRHGPFCDVVLLSPFPDMGAFYLNVFEQCEAYFPGSASVFERFLESIGLPVRLLELTMDAGQIVFCNYFAARPSFWRAWMKVTGALFALCEGPPCDLRSELTMATDYPGGAQRKVFLVERTASLLLALQPQWRVQAVDPFGLRPSTSRLRDHLAEAVTCDALKVALRRYGLPQHREAYLSLRNSVLSGSR